MKSMAQVSKLIPRAHLEKAKGNSLQNYQYCTKQGDFYEKGNRPVTQKEKGEAEKNRHHESIEAAKQGRFEDIPADLRLRYYGTYQRIQKDYMTKPDPLGGTCGLWIYGDTGTGKSHAVITQYPDRYMKPLNKWWDGYQQEPIVHLDELAPSHAPWIAPYLKKWADKWPFDAEVKGGALQLRPQKIIVTSNYKLEEMGFPEADLSALKRRFVCVEKFREQEILLL